MTRRFNLASLAVGRTAWVLIFGAASAAAHADQLTQRQLVGPSYMVSVCGGLGGGNGLQPGSPVSMVAGTSNCLSRSGSAIGGSSAQAVNYDWTGGGIPQHAQAQGSAGFGSIHLSASYSGTNNAGFDLGEATGGWQDLPTIKAVNPADNGQRAALNFNLLVDGQLDAKAIGGNTGAAVALQTWYLQNLTGAAYSTSVQSVGNQTQHKDVNSVITMSVSFTLGQSFTLGVFGSAAAQNGSESGVNKVNVSSSNFSNTVLWDGIGAVTLNGAAIDYSVTAASGMDWRHAVTAVPEPAGTALWAIGLCVLGALKLARQQPGPARRMAA